MPKRTHGMTGTSIHNRWMHCRHQRSLCQAWHDDFLVFYRAVGDPPDGMSLRRQTLRRPIGPGNWEWRPTEDLTGGHFGAVTVMAYLGRRPIGPKTIEQPCYRCRCRCGYEYTSHASNIKRVRQCRRCRDAELARYRLEKP